MNPVKTHFFKVSYPLFLSALLIMSSIHYVSAQNTYYPGFVVLNSGDTLKGKIQDRNINRGVIYDRIRFISENGKKEKYTAEDLISYSVESVNFESKWFNEETAFFKFRYTSIYGQGEKVFLRVNVKGKLTCYTNEYVDEDNDFFDGFELYLKEGENEFQRANQGLFGLKKNKLSEYFRDCPSLVEKINNEEIKNAIEVANYYNAECGNR